MPASPELGAGQQETEDFTGVGAPGGVVGQDRDGGGQEWTKYAKHDAGERHNEQHHEGGFPVGTG
ncbi:hypothetical protein SGR_182 [Streptomyces griseus subsp. griseus NBRC 13350]|uniref:Uncharacterized protein n=1 Tax=Streptomyces griseus subsp. griseus (strain JCM 4626 / CBS 651.72 / NBRC 13350 / KCC S-0626 / ISP 5235) TaxID=455632 RepID=B1VNI8_STRGG|nr:hypothetical protein SGR_182 [Streptomyces griseus subsp. griseus NBRC 13350]